MSAEDFPAQQQRTKASEPRPDQGAALHESAPAINLLIGAEAIALYVYGKAGKKEMRDIYRNVFGFSFFKHGNAIAALKTTINAELAEKQRAAQAERHRKNEAEAAAIKQRVGASNLQRRQK
jgi:hypothetical protein